MYSGTEGVLLSYTYVVLVDHLNRFRFHSTKFRLEKETTELNGTIRETLAWEGDFTHGFVLSDKVFKDNKIIARG